MATVTGATSGVTQIPQNTSGNATTAQTLVTGIGAINGGSQVSGNTLTLTNPIVASTPVVVGIGGSTPTNVGTIVGSLSANVVAVVINNTGSTTLTTSQYGGNETIVGGNGGLALTDNSLFSTVDVGGGTNSDTMQGAGNSFTGDGNNTITLNAANRGAADTVMGTSGSSDTIVGALSSTVGLVYTDGGTGSSAMINPTAGNVTIVGGSGSETVFGGSAYIGGGVVTAKAFTGTLTVTNGQGYFAGGANGNNVLGSSTLGGTTLIGGGSGDVLTSNGTGDLLVASSGREVLNAANSGGGVNMFGNSAGATIMYGSKATGDNFWLANSTVAGVGFNGAALFLHNGQNTTVSNNVNLGGLSTTLGATDATVTDFISGVDKVNVFNTNGQTASLTYFSKSNFVDLSTAGGTNILFIGTGSIKATDISGIAIANTTTVSL